MKVLVTGGAGYIGTHTVVELIKSGHKPIVVDNFSNSDSDSITRVEKITEEKIAYFDLDIRQTDELKQIIEKNSCEAVIHFAALKAVGESTELPLKYYDNNINGLISLLKASENTVKKFIFSSSATVYGEPDKLPLTENSPIKTATNPYGKTKQIGESILEDLARTDDTEYIILRYFNPIGAHESGFIGELPIGKPNNLVPYLTQAVAGNIPPLTVFGDDFDTPDGTGIRDYIHVVDLAKAHVKSLMNLNLANNYNVYNIGTGKGTSVLELIETFEKVTSTKVPYSIGSRRDGDIASCFASAKKTEKELGWTAELTIDDALKDAWLWQKNLNQK